MGFEVSETMMIVMISGGFLAGFFDSIGGGGSRRTAWLLDPSHFALQFL
ncbi:MAG: hypothetical protein J0L82_07560 [Deltaproteobacteria bacterium]|nr:hypothetical protein [Deltaproteobacteria bacterium]